MVSALSGQRPLTGGLHPTIVSYGWTWTWDPDLIPFILYWDWTWAQVGHAWIWPVDSLTPWRLVHLKKCLLCACGMWMCLSVCSFVWITEIYLLLVEVLMNWHNRNCIGVLLCSNSKSSHSNHNTRAMELWSDLDPHLSSGRKSLSFPVLYFSRLWAVGQILILSMNQYQIWYVRMEHVISVRSTDVRPSLNTNFIPLVIDLWQALKEASLIWLCLQLQGYDISELLQGSWLLREGTSSIPPRLIRWAAVCLASVFVAFQFLLQK